MNKIIILMGLVGAIITGVALFNFDKFPWWGGLSIGMCGLLMFFFALALRNVNENWETSQ